MSKPGAQRKNKTSVLKTGRAKNNTIKPQIDSISLNRCLYNNANRTEVATWPTEHQEKFNELSNIFIDLEHKVLSPKIREFKKNRVEELKQYFKERDYNIVPTGDGFRVVPSMKRINISAAQAERKNVTPQSGQVAQAFPLDLREMMIFPETTTTENSTINRVMNSPSAITHSYSSLTESSPSFSDKDSPNTPSSSLENSEEETKEIFHSLSTLSLETNPDSDNECDDEVFYKVGMFS